MKLKKVFGKGFEPLFSEPKSDVLPIRRPEKMLFLCVLFLPLNYNN